MLLLAKFLAKLFNILNGEISPRQIAAGFALGVWIGLLPLNGLMPTVLLLLAFVINVNLAILAVSTGLFKLMAYLLDPLANEFGFALLTKVPSLRGFWTKLYNLPVVPYTKFNNTLVMGSLVIGFLSLVPMYFLAKWGVVLYRTRLRERILKMKIVQLLKASTFYKYYLSYKGITGQ